MSLTIPYLLFFVPLLICVFLSIESFPVFSSYRNLKNSTHDLPFSFMIVLEHPFTKSRVGLLQIPVVFM